MFWKPFKKIHCSLKRQILHAHLETAAVATSLFLVQSKLQIMTLKALHGLGSRVSEGLSPLYIPMCQKQSSGYLLTVLPFWMPPWHWPEHEPFRSLLPYCGIEMKGEEVTETPLLEIISQCYKTCLVDRIFEEFWAASLF